MAHGVRRGHTLWNREGQVGADERGRGEQHSHQPLACAGIRVCREPGSCPRVVSEHQGLPTTGKLIQSTREGDAVRTPTEKVTAVTAASRRNRRGI
jgi:hypothetical protein